MMKDLLKEQYSLPTCRVLEVSLRRGILVNSGNPGGVANGFDDEVDG